MSTYDQALKVTENDFQKDNLSYNSSEIIQDIKTEPISDFPDEMIREIKTEPSSDFPCHEPSSDFPCHDCGASFDTYMDFSHHMKSHVAGDNIYNCIICGNKFSSQSVLYAHMALHRVGQVANQKSDLHKDSPAKKAKYSDNSDQINMQPYINENIESESQLSVIHDKEHIHNTGLSSLIIVKEEPNFQSDENDTEPSKSTFPLITEHLKSKISETDSSDSAFSASATQLNLNKKCRDMESTPENSAFLVQLKSQKSNDRVVGDIVQNNSSKAMQPNLNQNISQNMVPKYSAILGQLNSQNRDVGDIMQKYSAIASHLNSQNRSSKIPTTKTPNDSVRTKNLPDDIKLMYQTPLVSTLQADSNTNSTSDDPYKHKSDLILAKALDFNEHLIKTIRGSANVDGEPEENLINVDQLKQQMITPKAKKDKGPKRYFCHLCDEGFVENRQLKSHIIKHTGITPLQCSECGKGFMEKRRLEAHMSKHTGDKLFACTMCGKKMSRSDHLKDHMRIHTQEKLFTCYFCQKTFIQSSNLERHVRIHTGVKPFKCSICDRDFSHNSSMKRHKLTHGPRDEVGTEKCLVCGREFFHASSMKRHMMTHGPQESLQTKGSKAVLNDELAVEDEKKIIVATLFSSTDKDVDHSDNSNHSDKSDLPVLSDHETKRDHSVTNDQPILSGKAVIGNQTVKIDHPVSSTNDNAVFGFQPLVN